MKASNTYQVTSFRKVTAKVCGEISKGDFFYYTGGSFAEVKEVVQVSKMFVIFLVNNYDSYGNLTQENQTTRKYKITREFGMRK